MKMQRGQEIVEFALLIPFFSFLFLALCTVDLPLGIISH